MKPFVNIIINRKSVKLSLNTILCIFFLNYGFSQSQRSISQDELRDKIAGYWIGQCVGNYMGFPFESTYIEDYNPVFIDRYFQFDDDTSLIINRKDLRGFCPIAANWFGGAFSDDDTDIEFVTLHAIEKYGLDINYEEITEIWRAHINRKIWCANRTARKLMSEGLIPPATGSMKHNENWYMIDPQLVNEIWSVIYPGMVEKSVERAKWGAHITNDDWGTHPTIAYAVIYSAAVFEKDVEKLVEMTLPYLPDNSPYKEGIKDVLFWHQQHADWRITRNLIFDKYYRYKKGDYEAPVSIASSLPNGLFGIMAILYGEGDFVRTSGIAVSAGLDCDNQAATCAGLIGIMHGQSIIPERLTLGMYGIPVWKEPFNDTYINFTRDCLPIYNSINSIVDRLLRVAETAIIAQGGQVVEKGGKKLYVINVDF